MKILIVHDKPDFAVQIEYTFTTLFSSLGLDYEVLIWPTDAAQVVHQDNFLVILYGSKSLQSISARYRLHIHSSEFFGPGYLSTGSLPAIPLVRVAVSGNPLPILYSARETLLGRALLTTTDDRIMATHRSEDTDLVHTNLDLVASSFFMLSRYEEALSLERDQYDRFPTEADLGFREGFLQKPIVNLYARLLADWIAILTAGTLKRKPPRYPNGHSFGLCLGHDVDKPQKFTPGGLIKVPVKVLLRRESPLALRQMGSYLSSGQDPFWNFGQITSLEQKYGFQSTFFLIAGRRNRRYDPPYGSDLSVRIRLCEEILSRGAEVGLHGSFESYLSADTLSEEMAALQKHTTVSGSRQHFLRLDAQYTFAALEQAGLLYDCSLGFSGELGFRSGFAGPHYPFSLTKNRPVPILEIPLVMMDQSMWSSCCRGMRADDAWKVMLSVLEPVRDHNGCVSVLWHNGFFDEAAYPGYADLYHQLLIWLYENNGWGASGKQVFDWFTARKEA